MSPLEHLESVFSNGGLNLHSWLGLGLMLGLPWCLLTAMSGGSLFKLFFDR
jgi:hypothetical protein